MAIATLNPPYPLLFDYLLASSWTWVAICLATVATTLRALRVFLLRQRLLPAAIPISSSAQTQVPLSGSITQEPPLPSISSHTRFKRRARSKSTSALQTLHRNGEGFLRSGMDLLSSVLDAEFSPSFKKITSASKLCHETSSCEKTRQSPGLCAFSTDSPFSAVSTATGDRRAEVHNLTDLGLDSDDCFGFRLGLGFHSETLVQENEATFIKEEQLPTDEDVPSWLPSWAYSLCDPLQITLSFPSSSSYGEEQDSFAPFEELPFFEKQFGWDRLLEGKLGSSWSSLSCYGRAEESSNVVKMWDGQHKKLLKTLDTDALALDICSRMGLACTGNSAGEISLWELGRKAYAMASVPFAQPVVAVSMNSEQGATIVGSGKGMGLWDQRSPHCMALRFGTAMSPENISLSALKSRGSGLCIANSDNTLSMYDLRKLHGEPLCFGPAPKRAPVSSDSDDEDECDLLEKLTCDFEDDFWDEGSVSSIGNGVELQTGSSLLSRFASFMRVLSTSVL